MEEGMPGGSGKGSAALPPALLSMAARLPPFPVGGASATCLGHPRGGSVFCLQGARPPAILRLSGALRGCDEGTPLPPSLLLQTCRPPGEGLPVYFKIGLARPLSAKLCIFYPGRTAAHSQVTV